LAAVAVVGAMALTACASQGTVYVTVTTTPGNPGGNQVTAPSLSSSTAQGPANGSSGEQGAGQPSTSRPGPSSKPAPAKIRVSANPAFGTKKLGPTAPITLTVFNAQLEKVTMLGDDGSSISGKISNDKHTWAKTERLKYNTKYTVTGTAKAADGSSKPIQGTFTTVAPKNTMAAYVQIPQGETVGIAAPIVVTFAGSVNDRAAAEKMLKVTTTDKDGKKITVAGSWGWMQDEDIQGKGVKQSRVHFRTKDYWPAGTRVTLHADLYGVNYGNAWGREDITRSFKIGPNIVVKADVTSFRLLVVENDEIIKNYPVSYGKESIPGRNTVSGTHIVQEKNTDNPDGSFKMCNLAYGYCDVTEYWGVRINNNGEFIHVNKETEQEGLLGKANVSHGCVNMGMRDGKEFYDMVYYGIPVEVTNTGVKMSYSDYVWDWGVSYATWKTFSAL
jgi:lipoprotein-anchoring transpeptidase ErfK/SrfK